jgi:hypothetical protein
LEHGRVGQLPNCFKAISCEDAAASGSFQYPNTFSQENQSEQVPVNTKTSHLEQNDRTQEFSLHNIASFQVPRVTYKMFSSKKIVF